MPAREERGQQLVHRGPLADDDLADLRAQPVELSEEPRDVRVRHAVIAWMMMFTPNFVLSSARNRLLRKS